MPSELLSAFARRSERVQESLNGARVRGSNLYRVVRPRRPVLISRRYDFVYFQVPKVATRSLRAYLRAVDPEIEVDRAASISPGKLRSVRSFAMVRNPCDRLYSCWANKVRDSDQYATFYPELRDVSYEVFVDAVSSWDLRVCDQHVRLQSRLVPRSVGFVGRFEQLAEDHRRLTEWLELPYSPLAQRNVSSRGPAVPSENTPLLRERVAELYARDMERFGYTPG